MIKSTPCDCVLVAKSASLTKLTKGGTQGGKTKNEKGKRRVSNEKWEGSGKVVGSIMDEIIGFLDLWMVFS